MTRKLKHGILAVTLLAGSAFADFIQSPIPPSSYENYLYDVDGDGRLDQMSIKFLGSVSREYLEQMVDSLTFDWQNSDGLVQQFSVTAKNFQLDSINTRRVAVDLTRLQGRFDVHTSLSNETAKEWMGDGKLYLSDGSVFDVSFKDRMAPVVKNAFLRSYRGAGYDSLTVTFSEKVNPVGGCQTVLELKKSDGTPVRYWNTSNALWNENNTTALFISDGVDVQEWLLPRDSVRLTPTCIADSVRNTSAENGLFRKIDGLYPLEVISSNMVVETAVPGENLPIFQLMFKDLNAQVPNENEWGVAMNVMGPEFENAVRDALGLEQKNALDLRKLKIQYNLWIYTNLGAFVVGTFGEIFGNDSRFNENGTRLFLKWNLMDGSRKRVATGAYISNAVMIVSYDGKVVFRNDIHHGPTTQVFGVKRQ